MSRNIVYANGFESIVVAAHIALCNLQYLHHQSFKIFANRSSVLFYSITRYHTCSNRGKGCTNRELKDKGGCTIWYDEKELLQGVTERLLMTEIPRLNDDFSLPTELAELGIVYGEECSKKMKVGGSSAGKYHTSQIIAEVKVLSQMEYESQNIFLQLRSQFK